MLSVLPMMIAKTPTYVTREAVKMHADSKHVV